MEGEAKGNGIVKTDCSFYHYVGNCFWFSCFAGTGQRNAFMGWLSQVYF